MRNPAVSVRDDLVARPHNVLAGAYFDLARPGKTGEQLGDIDRAARKRADRLGNRRAFFLAHRIERDCACRDRRRVAVLHPQDDALPWGRGRQAGVAVGGPCIGVVGAGQGAVYDKAALAKGVEGVFDDIVPGCARDMDKELPGEIAELEARAHLAAIDRQRSDCVSGALAPFGDDLAIAVEQRQPARDLGGAVAGPVIDRDHAAMQRPGVAEQRKIGREIEGVEIGAAVGQALLGYPHPIEAQHLRAGRQIAL